jgi:hypothetical protein
MRKNFGSVRQVARVRKKAQAQGGWYLLTQDVLGDAEK